MFAFHMLMANAGGQPQPITLSGSLSATGTSGTVTSITRTVTVPAENSGVMRFENYRDTGTITTTRYSRNGGAFSTVTDGDVTVAFSDGDTITVLTNGVGAGEGRLLDLVDVSSGFYVEQNASLSYS